MDLQNIRKEESALLENMHQELPALTELLASVSDHWGYEDPIYRFYHQSLKVFDLQSVTLEIVARLQSLAPARGLNDWFMIIVMGGTGKTFTSEHNANWLLHTRPIVEAFFHARYFLEMAIKYGRELQVPPQPMPSGWAALLYLYGLR